MPADLSAVFWRICSECGDVCWEGSARRNRRERVFDGYVGVWWLLVKLRL